MTWRDYFEIVGIIVGACLLFALAILLCIAPFALVLWVITKIIPAASTPLPPHVEYWLWAVFACWLFLTMCGSSIAKIVHGKKKKKAKE